LNNFIQNLFTTKSSECKSAFNKIGIHSGASFTLELSIYWKRLMIRAIDNSAVGACLLGPPCFCDTLAAGERQRTL